MKNDAKLTAKELLALELDTLWTRVYGGLSLDIRKEFDQWLISENMPDSAEWNQWLPQQMCFFLVHFCDRTLEAISELDTEFQRHWGRIQRATIRRDREHHILACAEFLGQSPAGLRRDRAALARFFDEHALKDRFVRLQAEKERLLCFALDRLRANTVFFLKSAPPISATRALSTRIERENLIEKLIAFRGDSRVVLETLRWIENYVRGSSSEVEQWLGPQLVHYCYRLLSDPFQPVWLRSQGLLIALLLDTDSALDALQQRFARTEPGDSLFFRGRAIDYLIRFGEHPRVEEILLMACGDPSEHVRQCVLKALPDISPRLCGLIIDQIDRHESQPATRALMLQVLGQLPFATASAAGVSDRLHRHLSMDQPDLVLKEAMRALPRWYLNARQGNADVTPELSRLTAALTHLHQNHDKTRIRRWAAQSRETLWAASHAELISSSTNAALDQTDWQRKAVFPVDPKTDDEHLGRYLATRTENDFGYDVHRGKNKARAIKGHGYKFRLWRFLHELRNSATDKRQNYNHTRGRIYYGLLQVPGWNLAELSQTKVPGEPLHIAEEGNWRPYIPLVDHVLSSLDQGWPTHPLCLYTPEGITRIHPPRSFFRRLWAKLAISYRFGELSELRNWREDSSSSPDAYLKALQQFGFHFEIEGYLSETTSESQRHPIDPRVRRFFPGMAALPLPVLWGDFKNYFYSVYENSLHQLLLFLGAIAALFFGRHLWASGRMRQARLKLPLVIGGWGTRGKSGTERLKAALLNALGLSVLSKTTGCEAMFLYNPANRPLKEMFLFRPYDKASIWEQVDLVRLSAKFKVDVFLWECMGLTPRYVQILQEQWMRDDLSTITNCYPDHEDIQGPAGIDIPQVMQRFIPQKGKLITTEHNMYPFLSEGARAKGTSIIKVEENAGELLPSDVLDRFPYEEHPTNIALVIRMAEEIGLPADFAVKEMADRVVADLGVLKVYPVAPVDGRQLRFINGMSANERHAALANWQRLGLTTLTPEDNPGEWIATVVNNRADRIPRSQVFARMLASEVKADRHFLIGSNLDGLSSYIEESWNHRLELMEISEMSPESLQKAVKTLAQQLRVPTTRTVVRNRLNAMLEGSGVGSLIIADDDSLPSPEALANTLENAQKQTLPASQRSAIVEQFARDQREFNEFTELSDKITSTGTSAADLLVEQTTEWFRSRITIVWDFHAIGDDVVETIVKHTPPGLLSHTIGMQNIKGTGLDFVYRWQAWDQHYGLLQQLLQGDSTQALEAARGLASSEEFGVLDFEYVLTTIDRALKQKNTQSEAIQAELTVVRSKVEERRAQRGQNSEKDSSQNAFIIRLVNRIELLFDAGAAVKRRKRANRIYADLTSQRISHERAALELKRLNKEQKGGWLKERLGL